LALAEGVVTQPLSSPPTTIFLIRCFTVKKNHRKFPDAERTADNWTKKGYKNVLIKETKKGRFVVTARKIKAIRSSRQLAKKDTSFFPEEKRTRPRTTTYARPRSSHQYRPIQYRPYHTQNTTRRSGGFGLVDKASKYLEERNKRLQARQDERNRQREEAQITNEKMKTDRENAETQRIQNKIRQEKINFERAQREKKEIAAYDREKAELERKREKQPSSAEIQSAREQYVNQPNYITTEE
jgi:hypothetical protein